jgi:hypothetical protein
MPSASRPCTLSISAFCCKVRITVAVLLRQTIAPSATPAGKGTPKASAISAVASVVTMIWRTPPPIAALPKLRKRRHETSSPMVNSSSETPSSAMWVSCSWSTQPRTLGPSSTPATM